MSEYKEEPMTFAKLWDMSLRPMCTTMGIIFWVIFLIGGWSAAIGAIVKVGRGIGND